MLCPKDNIVCDPLLLQDVEIDVCPKCQGVWLEQQEVKQIVQHLSIPEYNELNTVISAWEVAEHTGTAPKDFWVEDKLVCPRDSVHMMKHYFPGSTIGVDHCLTCKGFWLDEGELHAIARYVAPNPTLERAWQMVIQDQKDWEKKMKELSELPARTVLWASNPLYGTVAVGTMLLKLFIDRLYTEADKKEHSN